MTWDQVEIDSMKSRLTALEGRLRYMEKQIDTLGTPWWKRLWFRVQGWPPWYIVAPRPRWRPWHRFLPPA